MQKGNIRSTEVIAHTYLSWQSPVAKNITFVGAMNDGPETVVGRAFPGGHHGHGGWLASDFLGIILTPALTYTPHIILLEVGMADMLFTNGDAFNAARYLIDIVNKILAHDPKILLFVATLPAVDMPAGPSAFMQFNDTVRQLAESRRNIILVDINVLNIPFPLYPRDEGYRVMAKGWYDALRPYLP